MVKIGKVEIPGRTALAPLAGVTNRPFRLLCREQGAGLAVTEMVSARGLADGSERSSCYLDFEADEHPISVQVFGSEPAIMAEGARVVADRNPDLIDINCGCPARKVVNRNAGAALMNDSVRLGRIIEAMTRAVDVPVTLKIRSGWDRADQAEEIARTAESAGASAIAVHGRTRASGFSGDSDWDVIRSVKAAVSVPVFGNGDVRGPQSAKDMLEQTGCDMVMIGRWAIGNPWIFGQVETYLDRGELLDAPDLGDRLHMAIRHLWASVHAAGTPLGVWKVRRHLAAYVKGIPGAAEIRRRLMRENEPETIVAFLSGLKEWAREAGEGATAPVGGLNGKSPLSQDGATSVNDLERHSVAERHE